VRAGLVAVLGGKKARLHIELLDRVHRGQKGGRRIPCLRHAYSVQRVLVVEVPLTGRTHRVACSRKARISITGAPGVVPGTSCVS